MRDAIESLGIIDIAAKEVSLAPVDNELLFSTDSAALLLLGQNVVGLEVRIDRSHDGRYEFVEG